MKYFVNILLDLMPDPAFYETNKFWMLIIPALAAIIGLIIYFIRKRKN